MALLQTLGKTEIWEKVEPFIQEMGAQVLFWREQTSRRGLKVELTLFSPNGVDMTLIERVHRLLLPRLEAICSKSDVILEISSPGVGRVFLSLYELAFYQGSDIRIWATGFTQPIEGELMESSGDDVVIKTKVGEVCVIKTAITQAKLIK